MHRNNRVSIMIVLGLALLLVTSIPPVNAHSLQWGLMPDSQFEFTAYGNRQDIGVVDIDYSLTITALETIPETPTFPSGFPRTTVSMRSLEDSTSLDMGNDVSSLCYGSFSAMPIGDWSYLSTVVEAFSDSIRDVVSFENSTHWGYSENGEWPDARVLKTTIYLKENGIMEYYSGSHWSFVTLEMIEDVTIKRIISSTSTTTTDNPTTSTTSPTTATDTTLGTTTNPSENTGMSTLIMAGAAVTIAVVGGISMMLKKRQPTHGTLDAKVLVICPYCGGKTEQGITRCDKCGADL